MENRSKIYRYMYVALFAALVCVTTMVTQIPNSFGGYVHIGDAFIYLAAVILPFPLAGIAGGLGAGLADLFSGYAVYVPATAVIKFLMAIFFTAKREKILCEKNFVALIIAAITLSGGYYVYEAAIYGFTAAIPGIFGNVIQSVFSTIVFVFFGLALDKSNFLNKYIKTRI